MSAAIGMVTLLAANGDVAGATVHSQSTDSNGAYLFADVEPGDYTITARIDDQAPAVLTSITLMPGQPATVSSLTLQPDQISLYLPRVGK